MPRHKRAGEITTYRYTMRVSGVPRPSIDGVGGAHVSLTAENFVKEAGAFDNSNSRYLRKGGLFPSEGTVVRRLGKWDYVISGVYETERQFDNDLDAMRAIEADFQGGWEQAFTIANMPRETLVTEIKHITPKMARAATAVSDVRLVHDLAGQVDEARDRLQDIVLVLEQRHPRESLVDVYREVSQAADVLDATTDALDRAAKLLRKIR